MEAAQQRVDRLKRTAQRVERFNTSPYVFPLVLLGLLIATIYIGVVGVSAIVHGLSGEAITFRPMDAIMLGFVLLFAALSLLAELFEFMAKGLERFANWLDTKIEEPQS